ncbi:hypothetical protein BGZ70_009198 [Mortierella alpina]|uniref:Cytosolic endo-beta-N-acetylglucosaminidase TIM barrel domain-containing protein n=1 Tax=Mortierella alpina TaxID=64518 RepID=A0A9P6J295_MORAP|nr:hypothetical protein BGZ70_009198 [Mortierella alpina]
MTDDIWQTDLKDCKVIACHDMAGGYKEDFLPQGNEYSGIYSMQYWSHIDTFIYFSHHRIGIPPPVWTNAAHRNGVRSIGTIITEWLPGVLETDEMVSGPDQALADDDGNDTVDRRWFSRAYADKLVDMAVYYKFDGWFINIESILRGGPQQADQTIAFLAYFRQQIHSRIPGGELHWYDSVISSTGEVKWQDKLSVENYRFFEQSDGIFTNYTWKEKAVGESVVLAGPRKRDVYTGIDIWGRNTFGGGGYTTYKALEVIQREKTSCALFAPAWTYEFLGKEKFMTYDRLFWTGFEGAGIHAESLPLSAFQEAKQDLLDGKLKDHDKDKDKDKDKDEDGDKGKDKAPEDNKAFMPVSTYIPARPSGCSSWFYTSFDRGFGHGFWINGKKVSSKPWSHLSHQSLAPSMIKEVFLIDQEGPVGVGASSRTSTRKAVRWIVSPNEAYHGGASIVIQEFTLKDPALPLPPLPTPIPPPPLSSSSSSEGPFPLATELHHLRHEHARDRGSKSVLVPLFDTRISLDQCQDSMVELVFKPCREDVQVGLHLGMLRTEAGTSVARQVTDSEFWNLLHPEIKVQKQVVKTRSRRGPSSSGLDTDATQELHPHRHQHQQGASSLAAESSPSGIHGKHHSDRLAVVTLDSVEVPENIGTGFVLERSLQAEGESGKLYSIEELTGGWKRLRLYLARVFAVPGQPIGSRGGSSETIVVSQLGVTLDYEGHQQQQQHGSRAPLKDGHDHHHHHHNNNISSRSSDQEDESSPLAVLGSLSVVPTQNAHIRGSRILGLKTEDRQVQIHKVKRPRLQRAARHNGSASSIALSDTRAELSLRHHDKKSKQTNNNASDSNSNPPPRPDSHSQQGDEDEDDGVDMSLQLRVSATVSWNLGFPLLGVQDASIGRQDNGVVSALEYSHFYIYLMMIRKSDASRQQQQQQQQQQEEQQEEGAVQFVVTAFGYRFRIAHFEMPLDHAIFSGQTTNDSNEDNHEDAMQALEQGAQELWVLVQGIRRDGRADERPFWAKSRLM